MGVRDISWEEPTLAETEVRVDGTWNGGQVSVCKEVSRFRQIDVGNVDMNKSSCLCLLSGLLVSGDIHLITAQTFNSVFVETAGLYLREDR